MTYDQAFLVSIINLFVLVSCKSREKQVIAKKSPCDKTTMPYTSLSVSLHTIHKSTFFLLLLLIKTIIKEITLAKEEHCSFFYSHIRTHTLLPLSLTWKQNKKISLVNYDWFHIKSCLRWVNKNKRGEKSTAERDNGAIELQIVVAKLWAFSSCIYKTWDEITLFKKFSLNFRNRIINKKKTNTVLLQNASSDVNFLNKSLHKLLVPHLLHKRLVVVCIFDLSRQVTDS